jgi:hypothetical protein
MNTVPTEKEAELHHSFTAMILTDSFSNGPITSAVQVYVKKSILHTLFHQVCKENYNKL